MHRLAIRTWPVALAFLAAQLLVVWQSVRADVETPRVVLGPGAKDLVVGPGMNAAGRDLRGCEFVTQDLTGAVFDGCNLYGVRIAGCILKRASFRGAIFTGGDIEVNADEGADFSDATVNGVRRSSDRFGLELSPAQLMSTWSYKNKDLHQCEIRGSYPYPSREVARFDFRGADLRQATLRGDLSKSDFTDARVYGAFFGNDSITFEQLASTCDYKHRSLCVRLYTAGKTATALSGKWDFSRINLDGSDLSFPPPDADFTDARINGCTIRNGLTKCQLSSTASFKQGSLTGLRLISGDLSACDLSAINLTDCFFEHCKFGKTNLEDAVITGARFITDESLAKSDRLTLEQIKSTWNYKHGRMEGIRILTYSGTTPVTGTGAFVGGDTRIHLQSHWGSGVRFAGATIVPK